MKYYLYLLFFVLLNIDSFGASREYSEPQGDDYSAPQGAEQARFSQIPYDLSQGARVSGMPRNKQSKGGSSHSTIKVSDSRRDHRNNCSPYPLKFLLDMPSPSPLNKNKSEKIGLNHRPPSETEETHMPIKLFLNTSNSAQATDIEELTKAFEEDERTHKGCADLDLSPLKTHKPAPQAEQGFSPEEIAELSAAYIQDGKWKDGEWKKEKENKSQKKLAQGPLTPSKIKISLADIENVYENSPTGLKQALQLLSVQKINLGKKRGTLPKGNIRKQLFP